MADDTEPLNDPMYQPLWRVKHNGEDALAIEWPEVPVVLLVYSCTSATEFTAVQELTAPEPPAEGTPAAWFYEMDREAVRSICKSVSPPTDARNSTDWLDEVIKVLLNKSVVFWQGSSEEELVAFGALDARKCTPEPETTGEKDEITYESEEEEIDWFS